MPIMGKCPVCKGTGKVPIAFPVVAPDVIRPKIRPDRMGSKTCPKCGGSGIIGTK